MLWTLLLFFAVLPLARSQSVYRFNAYAKTEGLSNNAVRHIVQDQYGFIWLGTDNGLHRFDGQEFLKIRYHPQDLHSLSSNYITRLFIDSQQNLWVGTDNGLNRLNTTSGLVERIELKVEKKDGTAINIRSIFEDRQQHLWVGTLRNGLLKLTQEKEQASFHVQQFTHDPQDTHSIASERVDYLLQDTLGYLWVGSIRTMDRMEPQTGQVQHFTSPLLSKPSQGTIIRDVIADDHGKILMTFEHGGVFYINTSDPDSQILPYFPQKLQLPESEETIYTKMLIDGKRQFWLGTSTDGVFLIDSAKASYQVLAYKPEEMASLSSSDIRALFEGKEGNIWIGTQAAGLNRGTRVPEQYRLFRHTPNSPNTLSKGQIRTIAEDQDGHLWIGHLQTGVDEVVFDENHQLIKVQSLQHDPAQPNTLSGNHVMQIIRDRQGFLWIGTHGHGLNKLDPRTGEIETYFHNPDDPATLAGNGIWAICEDRNGDIWLGDFQNGLSRLNPPTKSVKRFQHEPGDPNSLSSNLINTLLTDSQGKIWIGTSAGLNCLDPRTAHFTRYEHDPTDQASLSNNEVFSLHEDQDGHLWVGTRIGLNKFVVSAEQAELVERFYEGDGLRSNTVYSIQSDNFGSLWVGTDNGLAKLLPTQPKNSFVLLNNADGQENAAYTTKAHFNHKKTGWLFFGSGTNLLALHPDLLRQNNVGSGLMLSSLTRFRLNDSELEANTDYFVNGKQNLSLTHLDQVITFNLSELNWTEDRRYEYQLGGFNNQWIQTKDKMEITFTNLDPGDYVLRARGINIDNQAAEEIHLLNISVAPPWWQTWWAYGLYFLGVSGAIYMLYRFQLNRQLEKQETQNLRALNAFKNKLYTNITHEFRTPLTVISGMIEQVSGHEKIKHLIKRNSANLLNLVNQILDLRKMELGKLKLELVQGNLVEYIRYIIASYEALAQLKKIELHFIPKEEELWMDLDKEKLLRIFSNLLSNAIKFTPDHGKIYVGLEKSKIVQMPGQSLDAAQISVTDTGLGIPEEKQGYIFDRFYQVDNHLGKKAANREGKYKYRGPEGGTGIGLALTKELVTLMGGRIELDSIPDKGSTFTVKLPISRQAPLADVLEPTETLTDVPILAQAEIETLSATVAFESLSPNQERLHLLIIEDNPDVQQYLVSLLERQYEIQLAQDGQQGVVMALEQIPDLVISDVMMPHKDGFEVCDILKQDERTSHIPIILLTAKASVESRIQGLERGADAYLAKPFHQKELFVRLKKLIELRQLLQERYQNLTAPATSVPAHTTFEQEDAFMAKLTNAVEANLQDADFGTTQLCKVIGMSRSQLHLKIKALTNRSTSNFIRTIRLHKAKELLRQGELNVNQVAHEVGFSNPSYFSRTFTEEFGMSPKQFSRT